jgi:hypothetical protein
VGFSVILFESWHLVCHARPFLLAKPETMVDVTHALYLVSMIALTCFVSARLSSWSRGKIYFWACLWILFILDGVIWVSYMKMGVRKIGMIFSGLALAVYLTLFFIMTNYKKMSSVVLGIWVASLIGAFVMLYYEKKWCTPSGFPLHIITESILFVIVVCTLYILFSTPLAYQTKPKSKSR